jgi:hypothetical protein
LIREVFVIPAKAEIQNSFPQISCQIILIHAIFISPIFGTNHSPYLFF